MENIYDKVLTMKKYKLASDQLLIESNISIEGQEDVVKVLSVNSTVDVDRPIETLTGECLIAGKIITNVVYLTADGNVGNNIVVSGFSHKLVNENIVSGSKLSLNVSVVNTELNKLINNQIKIITTLNIDGVLVKNNEVQYLKDCESGSYVKQEERQIISLMGDYCEKFKEQLVAVVKTGVKKVLMTNIDCTVKDFAVGPNFVSVQCELCAKVVYVDAQENSELQTITISKDIKQEIEAQNVSKETMIDLYAVVLNEGILTEIAENEKDVQISIDVPIMVCINAYECNKVLSVSDVYSTKNILSIQNDSVENDKLCQPECIDCKVEGNVILSDNQPRIDKCYGAINARATASNAYVQNGELTIEGIISATVIYLNDELGGVQSVDIEVPYVIDKKVDIEEGVLIEPTVALFDVDVIVKRGREIYFDARAKAFVNITKCESFSLLSNVQAVGEEKPKDSAIEIYFAKAGETFWEIAKNLKIPSEIIRNQNPELSDPLEKDQNIALYYQKEKNA